MAAGGCEEGVVEALASIIARLATSGKRCMNECTAASTLRRMRISYTIVPTGCGWPGFWGAPSSPEPKAPPGTNSGAPAASKEELNCCSPDASGRTRPAPGTNSAPPSVDGPSWRGGASSWTMPMPPKDPALLVRGMNSAPPSAETAALSGGGGAVLKPPKGA